MKLLLTSGGISNTSIENGLKRLLNKNSFESSKMLFCTTASNFQGGSMNEWLIADLIKLNKLGFKIDVCDINGINKENFIKRFECAEVLFFDGGNTQWLKKCIKETGLENELKNLLENRVWVGVSAGSCVVCPTIVNACQDLFDENIECFPKDGLNLIDFQVIPHLNNINCPKIKYENIKKASEKLENKDGKKVYLIDDQSAVVVDSDKIEVISEGVWFEI